MSICFYRNLSLNTPSSKILAMTFDLDNTLYDNNPVIRQLEAGLTTWLHQHHPKTQKISDEQFSEIKQAVITLKPTIRHDMTAWRFAQFEQLFECLGYDDPNVQKATSEAMDEMIRLRHLVDIPKVTHDVLAELSSKIPLIAITNGNAEPDKIGLGTYFSRVLTAGPDGAAKPHSDLFHRAQHALGVPAGQILHIGDHLVTDVLGAKQAGFLAGWYLHRNAQQRAVIEQEIERGQAEHLNVFTHPQAKTLPDLTITSLSDLACLI